ncbi:MAG TPA: arylesterase [Puia sp.]|nr:arylesterase [Puia sp.]
MLKLRHVICPAILMASACSNNNNSSSPARDTATTSATTPATTDTRKSILFFGNSLTAGYGLNPEESFPTLIGRRLDSLHLPYKAINAGVSGETSAGGLTRINWVLRQPVDIFVLELGGNDGLRGIPVNSTRDNLQSIIDTVHHRYPACRIILAGMRVPPNLGSVYTTSFHEIFAELAKKNNTALIPFLLEGVGGDPSLNQPDGIHPNTKGEKIVTETVWKALRPLL